LPLWSRTRRIITMLEITRKIDNAKATVKLL